MENLIPEIWLKKISAEFKSADYETIRQATQLAQLSCTINDEPITESSYLYQGIMVADILHKLHLDSHALAAAILYSSVHYGDLDLEDVTEHLGPQVAKLIYGTQQMANIGNFYEAFSDNPNYQHNVDNIKKMFLAMVDDIRVVLIKLAEHLCVLRTAHVLPEKIKTKLAKETMAIHAPLTNRLGIAQLKWELEDLAFLYLEPKKYKEISSSLEKYFPQSNQYIGDVTTEIQNVLLKAQIKDFSVKGRTKHIYSIYRKMDRKKVDLKQIYDVSAIRIFVPTITDCYTALSHVHEAWQYIPEEFDDYIASPKPNGYSSIHTAVYGPNNCVVEIQIRTNDMHRQAELGVAAHWVYKEGKQEANYDAKLAWLRQIVDWQSEVAKTEKDSVNIQKIFDDHVYVFTPAGDILEMPKGATPLDFAYQVHTSVGHRCRGAKVNNKIVPLTHALKTGDRIEILTAKEGKPSRDWLVSSLGFLKSTRARSKVLHWFKKQSKEHNVIQGQALLDKEIKRLSLTKINLKKAAAKFNIKNDDDLFAALGSGYIKLSSILDALEVTPTKPDLEDEIATAITPSKWHKKRYTSEDINIQGVGNLLVHTANCCKPIPGEDVVGYVTQGKGIAIHRSDCTNVSHTHKTHPERFITVSWGKNTERKYPVDIVISALSRQGLVRDITNLLSEEKILITNLDLSTNKKDQTAKIKMTVEIAGLNSLSRVLNKINKLPSVSEVYRND